MIYNDRKENKIRMTDKTKFRPVNGTEEQILSASKTPGYVYFATDTGRIYLDLDQNTRISMGGSGVALLYGKADTISPDEQGFYTLSFDDLEDDVTPKEGDLILNKDGIFYRVMEADSDSRSMLCAILAVSGSGGSGGGGTSSLSKKIGITIQPLSTSNLINGQSFGVYFTANSGVDYDGSVMDDKLIVHWTLYEKVDSTYIKYSEGQMDVNSGELTEFELGEKLRESTSSRLTMYASGINSGESASKSVDVVTGQLSLTQSQNFSATARYTPDNVKLQCNAIGSMNKILDFYFDGTLVESKKLTSSSENFQSYTVSSSYATHGYHSVRIELYQAIVVSNTWSRGLMVDPIEFEIGVFATGNTDPVIWLGTYNEEYYNYDTIQIPFLVYDPSSTASAHIVLRKNGKEIASSPRDIDTTTMSSWNIFEIADADLDMVNRYSISCGDITRDITFTVVQDPNRTMEVVKQESLKLNFDAKGRSNSESAVNRETWTTDDGSIKATFKDFNWYNNGWVLDDDNNTCLRISNGAEFSIPIGTLTYGSTDISKQSNSIEIQFRVRNVQDYSSLIHNVTRYNGDDKFYTAFKAQSYYTNYDSFLHYYLPLYNATVSEDQQVDYDDLEFSRVQKEISLNRVACSYYSGDESGAVGICLGPQDAFFSNGTNTVNVSYVEDQLINISMVYSHGSDQMMYIYINGVLTGVIKSTIGLFTINSNKIVFNSNYCDIDLYKIRVYNTDLNVNDIVTNYSVDLKNVTIYDQNKLAEENTAIHEYQFKYDNMIKYNDEHPSAPLMPYIIFDTSATGNNDKLSYSKKTKINIGVEFINTGLDRAYANGELEKYAIEDGLCTANSSAEEKEAAVKKYYQHHCPSFIGDNISMAVQGTSSEFYPRRNYKLKTKNTDKDGVDRIHIFLHKGPFAADYAEDSENTRQKFFYMDNYTNGTTKFTMKIDYMESSGTYNMGFTSLIHNGYSKHPLKDYNDAGAFQKQVENYDKATSFKEGETYYQYDASSNKYSKTKDTVDANNVTDYYVSNPKYEDYTFKDLDDYRTCITGYRVLAFHKKSDGTYQYIGMYNMLLDKGSDEVYGFKPDKTLTQKFLKNKAISKKAECWEFENNARGFCSFRDPWGRRELSFKAPESAGSSGFTSANAPVVADSFEYRYNANDDILDILVALSSASDEDEKTVNESFPDYYIKQDPTDGQELLLDLYSNWEKAVKWVWSTCTENVKSQGNYVETNVGKQLYQPNEFYIYDETENDYVLSTAKECDDSLTYYSQAKDGSYVNAYACSSENLFKVSTFYTIVNGEYVLSGETSEFDESETYYKLIDFSDEELAKIADRLVEVCNDEIFDPSQTYYAYDGSVTGSDLATKVVKVTEDTYEPGKYYIGKDVTYGKHVYKFDTKEYRADKFVYELSSHFDIEYVATYFVATEVMECYDSRGKNCMMASWGPQKDGGDYIWYPIFYDLDTQLGINNTGIPSFEYNVDATEDGNFSTSDSVLWNNFYKYFKDSYIVMKYKHLKGVTDGVSWTKLEHAPFYSVDRIENWYTTNPYCSEEVMTTNNNAKKVQSFAKLGERPLIAVNLDEYYKYITICNSSSYQNGVTGHIGTAGDYTYDANGTYFYALQGDRSLSRQQFLTNRLEYIDSWLNQGNYQRGGANRVRGRVAANNSNKTSDIWVETDKEPYYKEDGTKSNLFDAEYWLNLTPIRSSYVTVSDDNEAYPSQKYDGVNPVKFNIDAIEQGVRKSANYPEQLLYIYGLNQMADLGDMSNLYWQEFEISGNASKLTRLLLGYDGVDESGNKWKNNNVNQFSIPSSKSSSGMPLLKEANFSNISVNGQSPVLDFTSCEKMQNFRATGSNFTEIKFAEGVALHTLYLPSSITTLSLTEANLLTNLITDYQVPQRDDNGNLVAEKGLYIQGMFEGQGDTVIDNLSLLGGNLGYDSYKLLAKYFELRRRQTASISKIAMTNVDWCPYKQLVEGDSYDISNSDAYYIDNGHYGFDKYTYNAATFQTQVLNGELYKLDSSIPEEDINQIADVEMLRTFIDNGLYTGTAEGSTIPNLTGIIYVNNDTALGELFIKDTLVKAFPSLTFFFKNVNKAYSAKFIIQEDDGTYTYVDHADTKVTEKSVQKVSSGEFFTNPYKMYNPVKDNYDFHGWSTTNDTTGLISSADATAEEQQAAWDELTLDNDVYDYTFYAVFTIHKWNIRFLSGTKTDNLTLIAEYQVPHGDVLYTPSVLATLDESALPDDQRYKFLGYTQNLANVIAASADTAKLTSVTNMLSTQDTDFYAVFTQESVFTSTTDFKYLKFSKTSYTDPYDSSYSATGYMVRPADGYSLSGKITLPTEYDGQPIISVGGFGSMDITHVYWYGTPQVVSIGSNAFNGCKKLVYFQFPGTVRFITGSAFVGCNQLKLFDFGNILCYIGELAFNMTFNSSTKTEKLRIPGTVREIGNYAFAYNDNMRGIATLQFGGPGDPTQITAIGGNSKAFIQNSGAKIENVVVYTSDGTISDNLMSLINKGVEYEGTISVVMA
jgi:hypothetical protein